MKAWLLFLFSASALAQGWGRREAMRPWLEGRFTDAERRFTQIRQALPEREQVVLLWEAEFEIERARFGPAAALIAEAKRVAGRDPEDLTGRRLARLHWSTGRFAEAWQVALEGRQWDGRDSRKLKVSSPMPLVTLGEILLARGEFSESIAVFERACAKAKNVSSLEGLEWSRAQNDIAIANLGLGSLEAASEVAGFALSEAEREWGPASIPAIDVLDTVGLVRLSESRLDEAEDALTRSRQWRETVYGASHPKVGDSYRHAALLSAARKDDAGAVRLMMHGLDIERALAVGPNGRWALALLSGAEVFARVGHAEDAAKCYAAAIPVLDHELGQTAPRLVKAREQDSALTGR